MLLKLQVSAETEWCNDVMLPLFTHELLECKHGWVHDPQQNKKEDM
jgi:hypothetical protein